MSFILDALKKSEHERQRQAIPGLVESSMSRSRPRLPLWALALGGLLAINLIVLSAVLVRGWLSAPSTAPARAPEADKAAIRAQNAAPTDAESHFSPLDASPVYAPEVPVASSIPPLSVAPLPDPIARAPAQGGASATRPARRHEPLLNDGDYKPDDEENLPSVNELSLSGAQALPELHLDVHVFATNAAERFVFINMRKYHEGATLQEGPTIERIRRDGVILNYQGLRFLLPRQ